MKISFEKATKALGHVRKQQLPNGRQEIPDLLKAKGLGGWAYHLKNDLKNTFASEIEEMEDLKQEAFGLTPEGTNAFLANKQWINTLDLPDDNRERLIEIAERMNEILDEERELTLTKGKIKDDKIDPHVTGATFQDLVFAIELETNSKQTEDQDNWLFKW